MARFTVKVAEVHIVEITVDADDAQDAQSVAEEIFSAGGYPDGTDLPEAKYDYTLDRNEWTVFPA